MMKQKAKTIAMICAQYPPNSGPGPTRMAAFAKGLAENGYIPHIFTSKKQPGSIVMSWHKLDNMSQSGDEMAGTSEGRGRKQPWYEMVANFFVPMEPNWTLSLLDLLREFKPFAQAENPSVIFTTSNPLASAVGGALLKRHHKVPLIVEFRDPWTLNPIRNWPTRMHFVVESLLEKWVLRCADALVMNTPTARAILLEKYKWLDQNKVHVISHGFDGEAICSGGTTRYQGNKCPDVVRIAYAGGFYMPKKLASVKGIKGRIRSVLSKVKSILMYDITNISDSNRVSSPETVLKAVAEYNEVKNAQLPNINIDFIGGEPGQLNPFIKELDLENDVRILPRIATSEIRQTLNDYDILFLTNPSIPSSPFIGTKTLDYLASGRPIIAELPSSNQAQLIITAKAGWICPSKNQSEMVALIEKLCANNCQELRRFDPECEYIKLFARKHQITDLMAIIEQVTGDGQIQSVISAGYRQLSEHHQVLD